ncbi:DNA-binding response regulator [Paenibacillus sp. PK3_47]|uniref:response regulator transcription factor n=1 Tax=Paenibacillus sp. PK3_47 TaxID=2072642 RepID=UPI00201E36CB|nr:response regulator [Paenibacillus sp. PK3_47]UQZ36383.1 DNA-binding response regulator [Paenibacillus sp. PK3_47]
MKVLIVDDESDVRDSIRLLVDWEAFNITDILEACDGEKAMTLIVRERPEIIFTDMKMPNMDGMALLKWIEDKSPSSKVIVISGYDDYTYIRNTIKHGGMDYLLKPISRSELLEALSQASAAWRREEEARSLNIQREVEINKTLPMYWDKTLSALVSRPGSQPGAADELRAAFGWSAAVECQVVMLLTDPLPRTVLGKFGRNPDLLHFLMGNICNEVIGLVRNGYAFKHTDPNYGLVLLLTGELGQTDCKLKAMNDALYRVLGARFRFACGDRVSFPQGIPTGFQQTLQTARGISFLDDTPIYHFGGPSSMPPAQRTVLADYASRITTAVHRGDAAQIGLAVSGWIDAVVRRQAVTWEDLKYWRYEYELLRSRLLQDTAPPAGEPAPSSFPGLFPLDKNGRLSLEEWRREWTEAFVEIAGILKESRLQENNAIYEIKRYIDLHYMDNLTLQEISGEFFLSREYVSRRFKQMFNENISEYLEKVRIDHAKLLLSGGQHKISSVAEMVGYQDGRYFSKIFSKFTGKTPREWRKESES